MRRYIILSNRRRVIIALVHTVAFLLLAVFTGLLLVRPLHAGSPRSGWIIAGIYVAVTGALLALAALSGNFIERIYFGLCAASAAFGLARQILGDAGIPAAVCVRVAMLACAVVVGVVILREHRAGRAAGKRSPAD
jgi:predicted permease